MHDRSMRLCFLQCQRLLSVNKRTEHLILDHGDDAEIANHVAVLVSKMMETGPV